MDCYHICYCEQPPASNKGATQLMFVYCTFRGNVLFFHCEKSLPFNLRPASLMSAEWTYIASACSSCCDYRNSKVMACIGGGGGGGGGELMINLLPSFKKWIRAGVCENPAISHEAVSFFFTKRKHGMVIRILYQGTNIVDTRFDICISS